MKKTSEFDQIDLQNVCDFHEILCDFSEFRLSYYPHRLEVFKNILKDIFGPSCNHDIYGDFKPLDNSTNPNPAFYIHVVEKS